MTADPAILEQRLRSVLALEPNTPFTKDTAREAILREQLDVCMCARIPAVDGRPMTFSQYYTVLFGERLDGRKWVPKEKRA